MALDWKDKVDGEDWVLAEDINDLAHAVQEVDDKKIDKITDVSQAGNFGGAYILNKDGTQGMTPISNTTDGGTIPVRETGGAVVVGTPTADSHAASKGYVDDLAATKLDIKEPSMANITGVTTYVKRLNSETGETYFEQSFKRISDGSGSVVSFNLPTYLPYTAIYGSAPMPNGAVLLSGEPKLPIHVATKNYVDKAVATVQGQLDTLGTFYEVVKVYSSGTIFVDIPTGAMPTAYIESADFYAYNTDGNLAYSGTANDLTFMDENWSDISSASFTAPAYIQIPENARQIRVNCDELVPDDIGWDAGPVVFSGAVYFQVKRG